MKLKKGDTVQVITGEEKGKQGKILEVFPDLDRVVVEGVGSHIHTRKNAQGKPEEVEEFRAIHLSNVMVLDPKDKKPTRIGIQRDGKKRLRIAKRSQKEL